MTMAQKRKFEKFVDKEDNEEAAKLPKVITHLKKQEKRLIVVLEGANLEVSLHKKAIQECVLLEVSANNPNSLRAGHQSWGPV